MKHNIVKLVDYGMSGEAEAAFGELCLVLARWAAEGYLSGEALHDAFDELVWLRGECR